jgi:hypothetical protein
MIVKRWFLALYGILAMLSLIMVSCDEFQDIEGGRYDNLSYGSLMGSMEFYLDGELKTYANCFIQEEDSWLYGFNGNIFTSSEHITVHIGNGQVGDHNGNSTTSQEYLVFWDSGVISSIYGSGVSTIHVDYNDNHRVEGTFSGTLCDEDQPTNCKTVTGGTFSAPIIATL